MYRDRRRLLSTVAALYSHTVVPRRRPPVANANTSYAVPAQRSAHSATTIDWLPDPPAVDIGPSSVGDDDVATPAGPRATHAVVSTFDMFSIGIGPSSSHSVGPMRAGRIFVESLKDLSVLGRVVRIKIALYGSLAATGKGHLSPQALLMGLEGHGPDTVDPGLISPRYHAICEEQSLVLAGEKQIRFDIAKDMIWHWDQQLPEHPNGLILSVFDADGDLLATNRYFSIGGGFVTHDKTQHAENVYYKATRPEDATSARRTPHKETGSTLMLSDEREHSHDSVSREPPFPFHSADSLLDMTRRTNMTIAQICYENERAYMPETEIRTKALRLWSVMNECIRQGVTATEEYLPGSLRVKRRARNLHKRLLRGLYPGDLLPTVTEIGPARAGGPVGDGATTDVTAPNDPENAAREDALPPSSLRGRFGHPIRPITPRRTVFPAMDLLSCYAIATNEVNAAGGRIITAPTNGAAGVIPAVLKYSLEFLAADAEHETVILNFLLTASAIGQLFKRGATISAAEGGCMAEVGVATSMAAAGFVAIMGGSPEQIERAAEIGIEHSLGLTCDPIGGLVQVPCIERNALGAVKAVTAAQLALASTDGSHTVSLDEAIAAMRQTAKDMSTSYKETSRSGLATAVRGQGGRHAARVPVSVPEC